MDYIKLLSSCLWKKFTIVEFCRALSESIEDDEVIIVVLPNNKSRPFTDMGAIVYEVWRKHIVLPFLELLKDLGYVREATLSSAPATRIFIAKKSVGKTVRVLARKPTKFYEEYSGKMIMTTLDHPSVYLVKFYNEDPEIVRIFIDTVVRIFEKFNLLTLHVIQLTPWLLSINPEATKLFIRKLKKAIDMVEMGHRYILIDMIKNDAFIPRFFVVLSDGKDLVILNYLKVRKAVRIPFRKFNITPKEIMYAIDVYKRFRTPLTKRRLVAVRKLAKYTSLKVAFEVI